MQLIEIDVSDELDDDLKVTLWRLTRLAQAGYDDGTAVDLALNRDIDLHLATALAERGCPADLALRILL